MIFETKTIDKKTIGIMEIDTVDECINIDPALKFWAVFLHDEQKSEDNEIDAFARHFILKGASALYSIGADAEYVHDRFDDEIMTLYIEGKIDLDARCVLTMWSTENIADSVDEILAMCDCGSIYFIVLKNHDAFGSLSSCLRLIQE